MPARGAGLAAECEEVPELDDPEALALSPDGRHLYVAQNGIRLDHDGVVAFSRDAETGALSPW